MIISGFLFRVGDTIICDEDTSAELYWKSCGLSGLFHLSYNFATMQTAAVVRAVIDVGAVVMVGVHVCLMHCQFNGC